MWRKVAESPPQTGDIDGARISQGMFWICPMPETPETPSPAPQREPHATRAPRGGGGVTASTPCQRALTKHAPRHASHASAARSDVWWRTISLIVALRHPPNAQDLWVLTACISASSHIATRVATTLRMLRARTMATVAPSSVGNRGKASYKPATSPSPSAPEGSTHGAAAHHHPRVRTTSMEAPQRTSAPKRREVHDVYMTRGVCLPSIQEGSFHARALCPT